MNSQVARHHYVVNATSTSGLGNLTASIIGDLPIPPIDPNSQKIIADFLDCETARLDQMLEKKQRLVALLGYKFESELARSVTIGRREQIPLSASTYAWEPPHPVHWREMPNRMIFRQKKRPVGSSHGDYPLLSLSKEGAIPRDVESGKGKFPSDFETYQAVMPGNIVLCLFDIDETPRTVGLSEHAGMVTGAYDVVEVLTTALPEFSYYRLLYLDYGKRLKPFYTGLRKVVRMPTFMGIRTPLPPLEEQRQIVDYLNATRDSLLDVERKTRDSIDRLREFRSALITAAVSGQLDVATWGKRGTIDRRLDKVEAQMAGAAPPKLTQAQA